MQESPFLQVWEYVKMVAVEFYLAPDKVEEEKPAKASNKTKRTKKETSK